MTYERDHVGHSQRRTPARRWLAVGVVAGLVVLAASVATESGVASAEASPRRARSSVGSTLAPGATLRPGESLTAADGPSRLTMRRNGNLVLWYLPMKQNTPQIRKLKKRPSSSCTTNYCKMLLPRVLWSSKTRGHPGTRLEMRKSGNVELVDGSKVLWSSHTTDRPGTFLRLTNRGNVVALTPKRAAASAETSLGNRHVALAAYSRPADNTSGNVPSWATDTQTPEYVGSTLRDGQSLQPNQFIQDASGMYDLYMDPNGAAVIWVLGAGPCPMWTAPWLEYQPSTKTGAAWDVDYEGSTAPVAGSTLQVRDDGYVVVVQPSGTITWSAGVNAGSGSYLTMQSDGNLVQSTEDNSAVWSSGTNINRGPLLCSGETMEPGQHIQTVGFNNQTESGYQLEFTTVGGGNEGMELDIGPGPDSKEATGVTHIWKDKDASESDSYTLVMQTDGNLVIYSSDGTAEWSSGTDDAANEGAWAYLAPGGQQLAIFNSTISSGGTNSVSGTLTPIWSNSCGLGTGCKTEGQEIGKAEKFSMGLP